MGKYNLRHSVRRSQSSCSSNSSTELITIRFVGRSMCSHAASALERCWEDAALTGRSSPRLGVERVEERGVALVDDRALDLERGRELAGGLREIGRASCRERG